MKLPALVNEKDPDFLPWWRKTQRRWVRSCSLPFKKTWRPTTKTSRTKIVEWIAEIFYRVSFSYSQISPASNIYQYEPPKSPNRSMILEIFGPHRIHRTSTIHGSVNISYPWNLLCESGCFHLRSGSIADTKRPQGAHRSGDPASTASSSRPFGQSVFFLRDWGINGSISRIALTENGAYPPGNKVHIEKENHRLKGAGWYCRGYVFFQEMKTYINDI